MTKNVELVFNQIDNLTTGEKLELFEALEDLADGIIADKRMNEYRTSGSEGLPARESFSLLKKQTCATQ